MVKESIGRPSPKTIVEDGDILVVYGHNKDIEKYCLGQEEYDLRNKHS